MSCTSDPRMSEETKASLFAGVARDSENRPIAELVYETPCPHMQTDFGPCLAHMEVYKYKLISKMADVMGFPSETHKMLRVEPVVEEGKEPPFPTFVLELNFGSKKFFSSGAYMRCLECAGFRDDQMTKCSETYTVCVSRPFLVRAAKVFVETIRFFGPRKCNCQSYAYYILNSLGVSTHDLLKDRVVETAAGLYQGQGKAIARMMEQERPTCPGDPNPLSQKKRKMKVEPLPIPSTFEQFELDEYGDPIGKKYMTIFMGFTLFCLSILIALVAVLLHALYENYAAGGITMGTE
eukprot:CAMPEP_0176193550 /NCGR_PEP_ID=MMETSP0121_2-20121125/5545_1 /TAXON_ID=160619 /ORGANISM="Kryptoperidinium foliaceum, Strain CCMP 1326" /LENGTH=293 /DNA_ID=CAMNT_0017532273 /DNA_START=18 /DNA_END=900 /DNA_ORIENTATION=-